MGRGVCQRGLGSRPNLAVAHGWWPDRAEKRGSTGRTRADPSASSGNLSQMPLRIIGYVAVLLALQYWIGLRPLLGW